MVKRQYHHFGIHVTEDVPGTEWIDLGKTWLNNPNHHPQRIEWIFHQPGTYEPGRTFQPHICYTVDDLDAAVAGKEILRGPDELAFGRAAFVFEDGIEVEYIQLKPGRAWFDDPEE